MGYETDPYQDEGGEPLMGLMRITSLILVTVSKISWIVKMIEVWDNHDRLHQSPTPVYNYLKVKPQKRLIKKSSSSGDPDPFGIVLNDDEGDVGEDHGGIYAHVMGMLRDDYTARGKRMSRRSGEKSMNGEKGVKMIKDDQEGVRNMDDDNIIDDSGVDPADGLGSDIEHSPSHAPQAEEGEENKEIEEIFEMAKKKKKSEKSAEDIALHVEKVMAELEVVAEVDAELNRQGKPAITKLLKLSFLTNSLSKKHLQQEFLDHGVLNLLKNWLEPLPDGSLPNSNVRAAVLLILNDFPIDLEQYDRKEQLRKSGLGKVIMFLSKSDEEITSNRKLAKELVDKWSRPIFNKSTRFEDMKKFDDERLFRKPSAKKSMSSASGIAFRDDKLVLAEFSQEPKPGQSSSRHVSRPEAMSMDFVVRPQSKVDPDEVRARAKQVVQDPRRVKMNKKLQQMKAPKRKQLQATKISVEGRGMVKYL